ncbi:MAG: hypothetical protein HC789_19880 [Microcoleus sp. CSU_2_2]|nr:hypothetical protein [Microcoleus sp. SU_5_3]NJS12472.1 hypothetical protein [Microcoleus sp. CSU_2_2]
MNRSLGSVVFGAFGSGGGTAAAGAAGAGALDKTVRSINLEESAIKTRFLQETGFLFARVFNIKSDELPIIKEVCSKDGSLVVMVISIDTLICISKCFALPQRQDLGILSN